MVWRTVVDPRRAEWANALANALTNALTDALEKLAAVGCAHPRAWPA
jgi:hypothetical protein